MQIGDLMKEEKRGKRRARETKGQQRERERVRDLLDVIKRRVRERERERADENKNAKIKDKKAKNTMYIRYHDLKTFHIYKPYA